MTGLSYLTGTPWHIDYFRKEANDPRRDRRNCKYHSKEGNCIYRCERCPGAAHCQYYSAKQKG